jgi:hypothetical protein
MIPARVSWALVEDGWILRNRIVWNKTDAMPESVRTGCPTGTKSDVAALLCRTVTAWPSQTVTVPRWAALAQVTRAATRVSKV